MILEISLEPDEKIIPDGPAKLPSARCFQLRTEGFYLHGHLMI